MALTLSKRRTWRSSLVNFAPAKAFTIHVAGAGPITRAPSTRTFMSSCSTPW